MISGSDRHRFSGRRVLDLESWSSSDVPLLRDPREFVAELYQRHLPPPGTTVVAVLDALHQVTASASFAACRPSEDGWQHRHEILTHLRQVTPHDLRLAQPKRTAVLLRCRDGAAGWTLQDGAWMWALRDAAALHGLRCGSYIALTPSGWQSLGDGRSGRNPHSGSWADGPVHTVTELAPRPPRPQTEQTAQPARVAPVRPLHRFATG